MGNGHFTVFPFLWIHNTLDLLKNVLNLRATYNLRPSYEHFVKHTYECS